MSNINKTIAFIQKWEGGFVDNPIDKGGPTNKGITLSTFTRYCLDKNRPLPKVEDLKNISDRDWKAIFLHNYWNKWQGNLIEDDDVCTMLVDWVWHSGRWGIIIPQRLLGVKQDGIVGVKTLDAVNSQDQEYFLETLREVRIEFCRDIVRRSPRQEIFLKGWINRINDI